MKVAKIFVLSKDDSPYPKVGDIRTIAILPSITKVYELAILARINNHISANGIIHKHQRGFTAGCSTTTNIEHVLTRATELKETQRIMAASKIPRIQRSKSGFFFIDFKKAFDSVPRHALIDKLIGYGFDNLLVRNIANMLTNTQMSINGKMVTTNIGVP